MHRGGARRAATFSDAVAVAAVRGGQPYTGPEDPDGNLHSGGALPRADTIASGRGGWCRRVLSSETGNPGGFFR